MRQAWAIVLVVIIVVVVVAAVAAAAAAAAAARSSSSTRSGNYNCRWCQQLHANIHHDTLVPSVRSR